jgi:hypothetical protein
VSLRIHRETWWDRFAKQIGLSYEFQFNDPEFDDELYVVSNAPAFRGELAETKALRYVLRLFRTLIEVPACGGALSGEGRAERAVPMTEVNRRCCLELAG